MNEHSFVRSCFPLRRHRLCVRCNHCCELNFDFFPMKPLICISPMASRSCPFAPLSVTHVVCSEGSPNCSHTCFAITWVSFLVSNHQQHSPEFLLGRHLVLCCSRLIHVLTCHIVILFQLLTHQRLHHELFHVLLFQCLINQRLHHELYLVLLFQCLINQGAHHEFFESPSTRSARIHSCPDFCLQFRSCSSISIFVTTFPNFDPSRCP